MNLNPMQQELALRQARKELASAGTLFNSARLEYSAMVILCNKEGMDAARSKIHDSLDMLLDAEATIQTLEDYSNG